MSLNKQIIDSIEENDKCIFVYASKGAGKSFLIMNNIIPSIRHLYDRIFFNSTCLTFEKDDKYKDIKKDKEITCIEKFSAGLLVAMLAKKLKTPKLKKQKWLIVIDDATSCEDILMPKTKDNLRDKLKDVFFELRHYKTTIIFACHVSRNGVAPFIRSNSDIVMCGKLNNEYILKTIYEDSLSMHFKSYREFRDFYDDEIWNQKYKFLLMDNVNTNIYLS